MKKSLPRKLTLALGASALLIAGLASGLVTKASAEPFKLGAEASGFIDNGPSALQGTGKYDYPAGQMVGQPYQGNASANGGGHAPRLQGGAGTSVALPPQFMGSWLVQGQRGSMDAMEKYRSGMEGLFLGQTQNTWNISGSPKQGYTLTTDQGVSTNLNIHKIVGNNQAFISYQHPVYATMAKELIVLELQNGGATFQAVEKIQIVKPSEGNVRATVKYNLFGQRQR